MSVCISYAGDYGEHIPGHDFTCTRCWVFDEQEALDEVARLRSQIEMYQQNEDRMTDQINTLADERNAARDEAERLRSRVAQIDALFAGGPDTSCRTTWLADGVECVVVPMADLRAALAADGSQ